MSPPGGEHFDFHGDEYFTSAEDFRVTSVGFCLKILVEFRSENTAKRVRVPPLVPVCLDDDVPRVPL